MLIIFIFSISIDYFSCYGVTSRENLLTTYMRIKKRVSACESSQSDLCLGIG